MRTIFSIICLIMCIVSVSVSHLSEFARNCWCAFFGFLILSAIWEEYKKTPKEIKDLHKYNSIDDVFRVFGVPNDVWEYGANNEFVRYTFKNSEDLIYKIDVFITHNGQLIKHESFWEF